MKRLRFKYFLSFLLTVLVALPSIKFFSIYNSSPKAAVNYATDAFGRTAASGWGAADVGGTYTTTGTATDYSVGSGIGSMDTATAGTTREAMLNTLSVQDVDYTFKVKTDKVPTGNNLRVDSVVRRVSSVYEYRLRVEITTTNTLRLNAYKLAGTSTEVSLGSFATVSGVTFNASTFYRLRVNVYGTNPTIIKMRAWADGGVEPAGWDYTTTDTEATLQASGSLGLRATTQSTVTNVPILYTFDDLNVDQATPPPPLTTANDTFPRTISSGWGTADSGGAYSLSGTASNFNVLNGVGEMSVTSAGSGGNLVAILGDVSTQDVEISARFNTDKLTSPSGSNEHIYLIARRISSGNEYRGQIRLSSSGSVNLQVKQTLGGVETGVGTEAYIPGMTHTINTFIHVRMQVRGTNPTTVSMRAWLEGAAEPTTWQYVASDGASSLQVPGAVGLMSRLSSTSDNAPVKFSYDDFTVTGIVSTPAPTPTPFGACTRPYAANSPWNTPIGANPVYDTNNSTYITALTQNSSGNTTFTSDPTQYAVPIYSVTNATPLVTLNYTGVYSNVTSETNLAKQTGGGSISIPIPVGSVSSAGSDGEIVFWNETTGDEWGFWQAYDNGDGTWRATNGYHYNTNWSGVPPSGFGSRGAGIPYFIGTLRACEVNQGHIDHALAFAYDYPSPQFIYPATKSDGIGSYPPDLPEGARMQLDPTVSDSTIQTTWGCTGSCFIIAKALQTYGMIVMDNSGRPKIVSEGQESAMWGLINNPILNSSTISPIPFSSFKVLNTGINLPAPTATVTPTSTINPTTTPSPSVTQSPSVTPTLALTVKEGKVFNSRRPALTGKSLPNSTVEVTVHSTVQTGTTLADYNGDWTFVPKNDLEDGEHRYYASIVNNDGTRTPVIGPVYFRIASVLPNTGLISELITDIKELKPTAKVNTFLLLVSSTTISIGVIIYRRRFE